MKIQEARSLTRIAVIFLLSAVVSAQSGGTFLIEKSVIAGGGGTSTGGIFGLDGTIGQNVAGTSSSGGVFRVDSGFWASAAAPSTISGTITYGNAIGSPAPPRFVSNVTITGAGSPNVFTTTGPPGATAGQYALSGFGSGSYTVTPTKPAGPNSAISSFDAARVAQGVSASVPFVSQNQRFAADVTGNGVVSSQDAGKIAQFAAGLPIQAPNLTSEWRFFVTGAPSPLPTPPQTYNDSRTYASVTGNLTGEDYVAILVGDVTGNWNPAIHPRAVSSGQWTVDSEETMIAGPVKDITVELPHMTASTDKEIVIPVNVEGAADKGIIAYEFDLRYDPTVIQPQEKPVDLAGTVSRSLTPVVNASVPGLLRVVMYGPMALTGNGILLNLKFRAVGAPSSVSPLRWERIIFNEGDPGAAASDGLIEISQ